jgi:predicted enzyme related to lactoylglutathione lyase
MKKIVLLIILAINFKGFSQDYFVTLGNAPNQGLIVEGTLGFDRSNAYLGQCIKSPIAKSYFGTDFKLEYGYLYTFKFLVGFQLRNLVFQDAIVGLKFEIPIATKKVLKTGNYFAIVFVPQVNFVIPMHKYETENVLVFTDYGPNYTSFSESGIAGGFEQTDEVIVNGALVVLYHSNLAKIKEKILSLNGIITKDIFSFPGGRRFHFIDPAGNELAIWFELSLS